ncbi:Acyl-CoA N-acyltransferase [Penicillium digitatum]|uniref:Acyl-CoA N-acyltransferase n=1 Tax=Penicillium digitatum TaxID=36651 RepID=A0A7T7BIE7_PENDI|nr:Acyl-CoA N-acyltransferase [Penicillium digitatum]
MTTTPHRDGTDQVVNQLAALEATLSSTSSNSDSSLIAVPTAEPQSVAPGPQYNETEDEEIFYHLRSLMPVPCLP